MLEMLEMLGRFIRGISGKWNVKIRFFANTSSFSPKLAPRYSRKPHFYKYHFRKHARRIKY